MLLNMNERCTGNLYCAFGIQAYAIGYIRRKIGKHVSIYQGTIRLEIEYG
jgi:hypothetical protein